MVKQTLKVITTKISGLREAAFWLAGFSLCSQLLALFRDRLLAHHFGTSLELDLYYAAFKVPDILFVTVASLVSVSALVPLFAKKEDEDPIHLREATKSIFTVFSLLIVISSVVAWVLMPIIIDTFFTGLSIEAKRETILLSRILLFSPLFLGFSNFFGSIVQYEKRFILYSLSPLLYNFGIIFGIVFLVPKYGILGPIWGVVLGALFHLVLQAMFVWRSHLAPRFTLKIDWQVIFETARLSIPRTFALGIVNFVSFFLVAIATKLSEGSIAVLNLSLNLQSVPLSLIGVSFSLAAFPSLAVSAAKREMGEVVEKISEGLSQIIFWSLPFTALMVVLRAHIVRVVLGSGDFDWAATRLVAAALAVFVASTVFQSIQLFLSRSHYALGKTKWPVLGNLLGGAVSVILALLFVGLSEVLVPIWGTIATFLDVSDLSVAVLALPFAYSVGSVLTALILFFALGREVAREILNRIKKIFYQSFTAAIFAGLISYWVLSLSDQLFNLETFWGVFSHGFLAGLGGIMAAFLTFYLLKNELIHSLFKAPKGSDL